MNIKRWIARREPSWQQLEILLRQAEQRGLKSMGVIQIKQVASLYRSVAADLARAQTTQVSQTLIQDLQGLTARAYSQIYQGSRRQDWQAVLNFYRWGLPRVIQQTASYIALATAIFLLAGVIAWWYSWQDPSFIGLLVPETLISKVRDRGELWMGSIVGIEPLASSQIMTNNLSVSFAAIAGGMTFGIYTVYLLFLNGLNIGAVATLVGQNHLAYPFWAFVFPHGALELPAIFIAGGAGLLIGRALLFPGRYQRGDALKLYGKQAAQLTYGVIPLLIIAGLIEGFFSPSPIVPSPLKYLLGICLFSALILYCLRTSDLK